MRVSHNIILFCLCVCCLFVSACNTAATLKEPAYTVANISDYKILFGTVCTEVKIRVSPSVTKEALEKLLNKILVAQYERVTPIGRPEYFKIRAYYDSDTTLKNQVGAVYQGNVGGNIGRIAFEYAGQVTHDRELEKPVLSREEKTRQEEVGKFAGELIEASRKAQNR